MSWLAAISKYSRISASSSGGRPAAPQRVGHVPQPGVALEAADDERGVAHAQSGVAALLRVGAGAAPVLGEEERQVLLRLDEVVGVEGAQHGVGGHPGVEAVDQRGEEGLPAHPVVECVHPVESRGFRLLPDSRP